FENIIVFLKLSDVLCNGLKYNWLDDIGSYLFCLVVRYARQCILTSVYRNFTCSLFAGIFNGPVIVFAAVGHFSAAVSAMKDIYQSKHAVIFSYDAAVFMFESFYVFVTAASPSVLCEIPGIFVNNGNIWICL